MMSSLFRKRKPVEVQYRVHGMSYGAEKGFLKTLRSCMEKQSVDLKFTEDLSTHGLIPVLLFCVNATHVTIEARKALAEIGGRPAFLIVMNHFPKHSHRKDLHSASHVQAQDFVAVLDCFFSDSDGMYDCAENTEVVKKVANQLVPMASFTQQHDDSPRGELTSTGSSQNDQKCTRPHVGFQSDPGSRKMNSSKTHHSSNEENTRSKAQKTQQSVFLQYETYGNSKGAERGFLEKLKCYFHKRNVDMRFEAYTRRAPISDTKPILLFCVNSSRVGTDAQAALQRIASDEPVILIVLNHFQKKANLANPHSATHVQQSNVRAVVDCFFFESDGVYDCDQNEEAVMRVGNEIVSRLNTLGHRDDIQTGPSMSSSDGSADPQPDISQFNQRYLENDNLQVILQYQKPTPNEDFLKKLQSDLQNQCHQNFQNTTKSILSSNEWSLFHFHCFSTRTDALHIIRHIEAQSLIGVSIKGKPKGRHVSDPETVQHTRHAVMDIFLFQTNASYNSDENQEVLRLMKEKITSINNTGGTIQTDDPMCGIPSESEGSAMCSDQEKLQTTSSPPSDYQYYTYPDQDKIAEIFLKTLEETLKKSSTVLKSEKLKKPPNECARPTLLFCRNKDIESETFQSNEDTIVIITDDKVQAYNQMPVFERDIGNCTTQLVVHYSLSESNQTMNMNIVETVAATIQSITDKHSSQLTK